MPDSLLRPEKHVLSTLEADGSRRWLTPKLSKGRLLNRRRWVAYTLIALYTLLPFVKIDGHPFVLLDLPARRFTLFGFTFLPTDTLLLALCVVGGLLGFFLLTALFGRVWCGWACPQTVYMEFVYRPIERLFAGTAGKGGVPRRPVEGWRIVARTLTYLVISFYLANVFLAYFVGVDELWRWMHESPLHRPAPFAIMAVLTGAMMVDFVYFREQMCIITCPYGRLQSALLDDKSSIVAYDARRGEPRGKAKDKDRGDCVDCGLCVQTCPTGIDIRDGLQMECINCTQCIDACNAVMTKLHRPKDLIRYSSQARDRGEKIRKLRTRVVIYPAILSGIALAVVLLLLGKQSFDVVVLRNTGQPFTVADDGRVRNIMRLKVTNRSDEPTQLQLEVASPTEVELVSDTTFELQGDEVGTFPITLLAPPGAFQAGQLTVGLIVRGGADDESRQVDCRMLGPTGKGAPQ
jgi:cytochrome c oxidase accessory protein FixG